MIMGDTDASPTGVPESDSLLDEAQPDAPGDGTFSIGPPQPIEDSRDLPAVAAPDEAAAVHGADLGDKHPDNVPIVDDGDVAPPEPDADAGEVLPGDDELDALVAGVDTDDVDDVGFDGGDVQNPLDDVETLAGRARMGGL
jgi:hypothetical protein